MLNTVFLPIAGFAAAVAAFGETLDKMPAIHGVHPVLKVPWGDDKLNEHTTPALMAVLPKHSYTKRIMTEYNGNLPDFCYDNKGDRDAAKIEVYEVIFEDSPQPLVYCYDTLTSEPLEKELDFVSQIPNNARSGWNVIAQYSGGTSDGGCYCWTYDFQGNHGGSSTACYNAGCSSSGVLIHEVCNMINSIGPDSPSTAWFLTDDFANAYNADSASICDDKTFEYWTSVCKSALYDINVPGGLAGLEQYGFDYPSVKHQYDAIKLTEIPGQLLANQSYFKGYERGSIQLKDTKGNVVKTTTLAYKPPSNTNIPGIQNTNTGYGGAASTTTTAAQATSTSTSASTSSPAAAKTTSTPAVAPTTSTAGAASPSSGGKESTRTHGHHSHTKMVTSYTKPTPTGEAPYQAGDEECDE